MTPERLSELRCPAHGTPLEAKGVQCTATGHVDTGILECAAGHAFRIRGGIPRFREDSGYADSFGRQWNHYRQTQLDSVNGTTLTRDRFFAGTGWTAGELKDARVLEVGCGAGRFTEILLSAGAVLSSLDYSSAVDACFANNGANLNLLLVQGDVFELPFAPETFDYVFCYGVLQHTPDPKRAFMNLARCVRPGGKIAVDSYRKGWELQPYKSKYLYRPITTRMSAERLLAVLNWYIPKWLPIDTFIKKVPLVGPALGMLIPCWNYSYLPLPYEQQVEWAVLDTFDALAPKFDLPQTAATIRNWFEDTGLEDVVVRHGGNGVLGNGRRPERAAS